MARRPHLPKPLELLEKGGNCGMSGPDNRFELMAREAAQSIDNSRELQRQLSLLPDETAGAELVEDGKAKRGPGKALNQMREFLAAKGYRLPEDVLAEMAGLASREDAIMTAMVQAERILAWAGDGARNLVYKAGVGHVELEGPWKPSPAQKRETFMQVYTLMLRAADALMPYGAPKVTPETVTHQQVNQIIVQGGASAAVNPADRARDVTPGGRRIAPPPMPGQSQGNQAVSRDDTEGSDA